MNATEELEMVEEIEQILRTVPVKDLMEFMIKHPEYHEKAATTIKHYMEYFPEDCKEMAIIYTAAGFYHRFHKKGF